MSVTRCLRAQEDVVGLLEGTASDELRSHIASCDACRDAAHDVERLTARLASAGDDFVISETLSDRLVELARASSCGDEPVAERVSETRMRTTGAPNEGPVLGPATSRRLGGRLAGKGTWLVLAACVSVGASAIVGLKLADRQRSPVAMATRAWHGKVGQIAKSGADKSGAALTVVTASGEAPLAEGAEVKSGMKLRTDPRTRARIDLDDGSVLVVDRGTLLSVVDAPRTLDLADGAIMLDVAHVDGAPPSRVQTPNGEIRIIGTKLAVTAASDRTNVEVLRGEVEVVSARGSQRVGAGQEGVVAKDGTLDVAPANDLAQRAAFGEQLLGANTHNEDADAPASGLGELRAKRPGKTDEKDRAVRLAKHAVKIRIAGNVARTEIDEQFANDTDDELEGIYRFPLPPGAQIERLALEVDGKLLDGEFIDKAKASAIWRGAIQNAAPKAPKPKEEIVWVPGPWHDPALLEWQRGGRFELRIFPIPKRGSRRVVIAYTETVAPVSGARRYVYPLPQGASSKLTIDDFSVDAQVLGHQQATPVRARGYELETKREGAAEKLSASMRSFTPSGDLAIEYALDDKKTDATAWAFAAPQASPTDLKAAAASDPIGSDAFVAIALRPKLPRWADTRPRDHVLVVDSGRSMFGERFLRARRLAVQISQEMDRRDRLTVLACDVTCRAMPAGFVGPGATGAHDVDAFLANVTTDGASDLVSAVRAASAVTGHDKDRDLRVVLLSDGVATAGYRTPGRVAAEVADAMAEARAEVVAVPIGADADTTVLGEIARGGGGVVVPYQPGQRLEGAALEVLSATYGTTLRDVEVVLPEGLRDMAPAALAPLRAGSETIVTARLKGDAVKGDVILRGKVGGDPFEARYPIDVRATTDAGNAFVPRLFAAARIADRERETYGAEAQKAELVALSRRFAVPSRFTSLLVLESEAMFKAFGIERSERSAQWTGEVTAQGNTVATIAGEPAADLGFPSDPSNPFGQDEHAPKAESEAKKDKAAEGSIGVTGHGAGGAGSGFGGIGASTGPMTSPAAPAATMAPGQSAPPPPAKPAARATADLSDPFSSSMDDRSMPRRRPAPLGGRFMKKIFVRHASVSADATPPVPADKIAQARAAVAAAPDERSKHKDLARLLAVSGQLDELNDTLEKWSTRDPLDADVIYARSDLASRRGDRDLSLRILSGALSASAMSSSDAFTAAGAIARSFDRAGRPEACAFHVTAAELRPSDIDAVAHAVACERARGRSRSSDRWLGSVKDAQRASVSTAAAKIDAAKGEQAFGDVVVAATWDGGADLDVALIDPNGRRAGVASRMKGTRVEGSLARDHETVALATGDAGSFIVEVSRAHASEGTIPVNGRVTIRAFGGTQTIPFTLTGARTQVGRVDVRWDAELVPIDGPTVGVAVPAPFDRGAAAAALSAVSLAQCNGTGQVGTGHATVTFSPTGRVADVVVDDASFSGTPAGRCVRVAFFSAQVPSFSGSAVTVGKTFHLGGPR